MVQFLFCATVVYLILSLFLWLCCAQSAVTTKVDSGLTVVILSVCNHFKSFCGLFFIHCDYFMVNKRILLAPLYVSNGPLPIRPFG